MPWANCGLGCRPRLPAQAAEISADLSSSVYVLGVRAPFPNSGWYSNQRLVFGLTNLTANLHFRLTLFNDKESETKKKERACDRGCPMTDLSFFSNPRYVEKEHLQYCAPSGLSSGLASLPLDFIYINGTKTNRTTTKTLPTGEKLDGKATYLKLMQYFTTTEKTPDEIYELGWSIINRYYPEVRLKFSSERRSGFSVLVVNSKPHFWKSDFLLYFEDIFPIFNNFVVVVVVSAVSIYLITRRHGNEAASLQRDSVAIRQCGNETAWQWGNVATRQRGPVVRVPDLKSGTRALTTQLKLFLRRT